MLAALSTNPCATHEAQIITPAFSRLPNQIHPNTHEVIQAFQKKYKSMPGKSGYHFYLMTEPCFFLSSTKNADRHAHVLRGLIDSGELFVVAGRAVAAPDVCLDLAINRLDDFQEIIVPEKGINAHLFGSDYFHYVRQLSLNLAFMRTEDNHKRLSNSKNPEDFWQMLALGL